MFTIIHKIKGTRNCDTNEKRVTIIIRENRFLKFL